MKYAIRLLGLTFAGGAHHNIQNIWISIQVIIFWLQTTATATTTTTTTTTTRRSSGITNQDENLFTIDIMTMPTTSLFSSLEGQQQQQSNAIIQSSGEDAATPKKKKKNQAAATNATTSAYAQQEGGAPARAVQQQQVQLQEEDDENNNAKSNENDTTTMISLLASKLDDCLSQLSVDGTEKDDNATNRIATFIHDSMSREHRNYHSTQHLFDLSDRLPRDDPVGILSALFHDVVQLQVDGGLSRTQRRTLGGLIIADEEETSPVVQQREEDPSQLSISPPSGGGPEEENSIIDVVRTIFGFRREEQQPSKGLNEFLSAAVAVRVLEDLLPRKVLAQVAVGIQATIPFALSPAMEDLYGRLVDANRQYRLGLTEDEMVASVQRAVSVANADVANFASSDHGKFLDNTWSLLPESNHALAVVEDDDGPDGGGSIAASYRIGDLRGALWGMRNFFNFLTAERVFRSFRGVPDDESLDELRGRATKNLRVGRKYITLKLVGAVAVEAVATLLGIHDAPVGSWTARRNDSTTTRDRLLAQQPASQAPPAHVDADVYSLLSRARKDEVNFNLLPALLYGTWGDDGLDEFLRDVELPGSSIVMDEDSATGLLSRLPRQSIDLISSIFESERSDSVRRLFER